MRYQGTPQPKTDIAAIVYLAMLAAAAIMILGVILGSWYTIDTRERGVILRFGEVAGIAGPGLHFKMPFIDDVEYISIETYTERVEKLNAGSADQQPADMAVSATYRVNPERVADIYSRFRTLDAAVERVIRPRIQSRIKVAFGKFTAARTFSERGQLNDAAQAELQGDMEDLFIIDGVQIENIEFDAAYTESISQRMVAEVAVAKKQQELEKEIIEARIKNTQADAEAYGVKAAGEAEASAIEMRGKAEASAIKAKSEALKESPNLVNLTLAQNWKGSPPQTVITGSGASAAVPVLPLMTERGEYLGPQRR